MSEIELETYVTLFALGGQLADETIDAILGDLPSCDCIPLVVLARRAFTDRREHNGMSYLDEWREAQRTG